MSVYVLAARGKTPTCRGEILSLFTAQGFRLREQKEFGGSTLWLIDNPGPSVITTFEDDAGNFIAAVGAFIYEGRTGDRALATFLSDFPAKHRDLWAGTRGHFTLIVRYAGVTYILCDGLGAHKIYHLPDFELVSNSFLAVLAGCHGARFDTHGVYAYAWAGACFGGRTFVESITSAPANALLQVDETARLVSAPSPVRMARDQDAPADYLADNLDALTSAVGDIVATAEGPIALSFSGGYDSRLLLAALAGEGVSPGLFVYGRDRDTDVDVAKTVAAGETLELRQVDKSRQPPDGEALARVVKRDLVFFDGWKNEGLIDSGADYDDRVNRHAGGAVPLNGGLGEIYRNFYNLRDTQYTAEEVVASFYMQFQTDWATEAFDRRAYERTLADQMRRELGTDRERLTAQEAQLLYPLFRGRYWTAREAEINQRFGRMHFPYLEHACIAAASWTPMADRHFGYAQREMIRRLNPRLARYPSSYGFSFSEKPSWRYRADVLKSLARPVRTRPLGARIRRNQAVTPPALQTDRLASILDPTFPHMRRFFRIENVDDVEVRNRIATLEYLATTFALKP
jgi:asparagine synthase (glutamine-hydrolysing)